MPDQTALRSEGGGGEEEAYFLFRYARRRLRPLCRSLARSLRRWLASHFTEKAISDGRKSSVMRGFSLQDCAPSSVDVSLHSTK